MFMMKTPGLLFALAVSITAAPAPTSPSFVSLQSAFAASPGCTLPTPKPTCSGAASAVCVSFLKYSLFFVYHFFSCKPRTQDGCYARSPILLCPSPCVSKTQDWSTNGSCASEDANANDIQDIIVLFDADCTADSQAMLLSAVKAAGADVVYDWKEFGYVSKSHGPVPRFSLLSSSSCVLLFPCNSIHMQFGTLLELILSRHDLRLSLPVVHLVKARRMHAD